MARSHTIYLSEAAIPEWDALQIAIKALKVHVDVDRDYVPFETSGYLPVTVEGEDAGFDIRFIPNSFHANAPGRDVAIAVKWGGDPREFIAAAVVSAAFAKGFDGVILGAGDTVVNADDLLNKAKAEIEESF